MIQLSHYLHFFQNVRPLLSKDLISIIQQTCNEFTKRHPTSECPENLAMEVDAHLHNLWLFFEIRM